jgi:hypothetical protein
MFQEKLPLPPSVALAHLSAENAVIIDAGMPPLAV